jgi:glycosyltransferase involved in cell wall biosynthesis
MAKNKIKIVIATPALPPEIGGSSFYAEMLSGAFLAEGRDVSVVAYGFLKKLPTGLRHIFYAAKLLPSVLTADFVVALDTFSAAVPTVFVSRLFGKKIIVRVGGDFLWEEYAERTRQPILLSEFYSGKRNFSPKEKCIFNLTKFSLQKSSAVVFSTDWQKNIFAEAYGLDSAKIFVVENIYPQNEKRTVAPKNRIILSPSRDIFLKNKIILKKSCDSLKEKFPEIVLDTRISGRAELLSRLIGSYCLIVPSLSEVSPNIVLDAVSLGVPVAVTEDCGLRNRLQNLVVWIDPRKSESVAEGLAELMDEKIYDEYLFRLSKFSFVRSPKIVAEEFISIFEKI